MPFRDSISMIIHDVQANRKASLTIEPSTNVSTLDPRLMAIQNNSALFSTSRSSSAPPKVGQGLYNKSRKREIIEITNDTDNAFQTPAKKIDLGVAITALLKEIAQSRQAKEAYKTNQQKALKLLQKEYKSRLKVRAFLKAIALFKDDGNAVTFLTLDKREYRDLWLEGEVGDKLKD
jgi:hypothetical protein